MGDRDLSILGHGVLLSAARRQQSNAGHLYTLRHLADTSEYSCNEAGGAAHVGADVCCVRRGVGGDGFNG